MKSTRSSPRATVQFVVVIVAFCLTGFAEFAQAGAASERLHKTLFSDYNMNVIPVANEKESLTVYIGFKLADIVDLDVRQELLQSNMWITMNWTDYKLKWNPDEYNGVRSLVIPHTMIWKPTILLENRVLTGKDTSEFSRVRLHNDGLVEWLRIGQFSTACAVNIEWFPFDEQTCDLIFVSWYHEDEMILLHRESTFDPNKGDTEGEWMVVASATNATGTKQYSSFSHQTAVFSIRVRRQPLYYMTNLVLPCTLISCLAALTFILPPDGGEKIGLSITVLLTLTVFLMVVGAEIPPTPHTIPMIDVYVILLMILCTLSVVASCFVLRFYSPSPGVYRMPNWIRFVFCNWLAWILRVKRPGIKQSLKEVIRKSRRSRLVVVADGSEDEKRDLKRKDETPLNPVVKSTRTSSDDKNLEQLMAIYEELQLLTGTMKDEAAEKEMAEEWKYAATVLDRLCLWLFVTCFVIATLVVYFRRPHYGD